MTKASPFELQRLKFAPCCPAIPTVGATLAIAISFSSVLAPSSAQAACLTTVGENVCATFDASTPSTTVQPFTSANLGTNRYFQLSLLTNAGFSYTITDLAWSKDGTTFNAFSPISLSLNSNGSRSYTNIVDYGSAVGVPLYLRYTLPTGVALGKAIEGTLIANNNGANNGGVLSDSLNNYQFINRDSLSVQGAAPTAVPGPLPIFGAAGFFAFSRRLRRRIKA